MTDKSTPTKKEFLSNDKASNNISTSTNILNQDNIAPLPNLTNSDNFQNKNTQNYTFKIIKRRAPWNKKEDEAIIELVNKYGTSNWTIIANEMALMYKSKHRNGKQCRERWHNHLDPIVNKENWTEEEENILFNKHMEYGNKWSDISKYLPGRTDNSIKNHFYSKLRKFIRKILKQINKENLLKNNGIDYYKYNSDKVYKLLKKYKITYKNVTKDTILNLIIATEKNQKGKIFGLNDEKNLNNNNINNDSNGKKNEFQNFPFNLDNNLITNSNDKQSKNNSASKLMNKSIINKKSKLKSKSKNNDEINCNQLLIKKDKKIFQSSVVTEIKPIKNDLTENKNNNILLNQINNGITNKVTRKYKRKNKNFESEYEKDNKKENMNNENNNKEEDNDINNSNKKKLNINLDYIQQTSKFKKKSKSKIKDKNINGNQNKKLLNKKRRRKKRRKVTISLSTPENKKDQINRIMPRRNFIFGLGQRLPIRNKLHKKNSNKKSKFEINPEDFDPTINEVEIVRDGLEIHSKYIIVINKSLLTEKILPEMNYQYKPHLNLNIEFPLSPRVPQFPTNMSKTMKNGDENVNNFNERNMSIGLPTPMDGLYEGQISPMGSYNLIMFPPPSTKNIYNVDFGFENKFLRKNFQPFTPKSFINGAMITPNTPKKEINLQNKIVIQNNNNISGGENNDENNLQEKSKKPAALNLDIIDNFNNENNIAYPGYPFFGGNEIMGSSIAKQTIPTPANIFNLSPTSPFIPRTFGDKNL